MSGKRVVITGGTFEEPAPQPGFRSRRSYVQRQLEVTVQLAASQATGQPITFAGTAGSDTVTLSGFRTRVRIEWADVQAEREKEHAQRAADLKQAAKWAEIKEAQERRLFTVIKGRSGGNEAA